MSKNKNTEVSHIFLKSGSKPSERRGDTVVTIRASSVPQWCLVKAKMIQKENQFNNLLLALLVRGWATQLENIGQSNWMISSQVQVNMLKSHWIHYLDLAFQLQVSVILRLMGLSFRLGVQHPTVTSAHQAYMISYSTGCTKDYCQTHHTLRVKVHTTT